MSGNKKFKYFTFSKLNIPESGITDLYGKKYINLISDRFELTVSMLSEKTVEHFIIGMFEKQRVKIFDRNIESEFFINTVEMVPEPEYRNEMTFKTISPVVLSRNSIHNGKESQEYISPADKEYAAYFIKNLIEKHVTLFQSRAVSETGNSNNIISEDSEKVTFEQTGEYKSKLITIKEGTSEESKVRGFFYTFRITGDPDIIRTGYEAGFGKQCSLGFGCAEVAGGRTR
jgi:CRISPR-associated endoribonuclease Cas6